MSLLDGLMSPLDKEHCGVYYAIGLMFLFFAVLALVNGVIQCFDKKTRPVGLYLILNSVTMFFTYYLYRIMYSMCDKIL
jgi:uncharacterized membrane-anchored protein